MTAPIVRAAGNINNPKNSKANRVFFVRQAFIFAFLTPFKGFFKIVLS
jgi:hypothetical protein